MNIKNPRTAMKLLDAAGYPSLIEFNNLNESKLIDERKDRVSIIAAIRYSISHGQLENYYIGRRVACIEHIIKLKGVPNVYWLLESDNGSKEIYERLFAINKAINKEAV